MDLIKHLLKFIGGLAIGAAVGLLIAGIGFMLFTDMTFSEYLESFSKLQVSEGVGVVMVAICSFIVSLMLLVTIHELGHLVCGLLSGYRFVSFRVFNFTFINIDGRLRVKRFGVPGTGGQCLLDPPHLPIDRIPTGWYNAGGVLANVVVGLLVLPLMWAGLPPLAQVAIVVFLLTDLFLILMNGIPVQAGGIGNDAYNMLHLNRNLESKRGMVAQLRSNALIQNGVRPKDMPEEWFDVPDEVNYKNALEVTLPLMRASRLMDEMRMEEAQHEFEKLYAHKDEIMPLYAREITCELSYLLMTSAAAAGKNAEDREVMMKRASSMLDKEVRKYVAAYRKVMSSKQRLECAIALYLDGDRQKAVKIYDDLQRRQDDYLLQGEVKSDLALMAAMPGLL